MTVLLRVLAVVSLLASILLGFLALISFASYRDTTASGTFPAGLALASLVLAIVGLRGVAASPTKHL